MSRIQLLLPLLMWAVWHTYPTPPVFDPWLGLVVYIGVLLGIVGGQWFLGRRVARQIDTGRLRATGRFQQTAFAARWLVLLAHAGAMFAGGLGFVVLRIAPPWLPADVPAALVSMLPVLLAWVGLLWSQYRVDVAVRERSVLAILDAGLPVHAPPTLRQYLVHGVRTQMLFTLFPVLLAIALRDLFLLAGHLAGVEPGGYLELLLSLMPIALVFVIAPELLRRILPTRPLPDSPLRRKLESDCERLGLRYRDILLWQTSHNVANAAVMGLIPQVRYVMLTDLLIETLDDRQIEAVFAHEAGHVIYRHISWFVVYSVLYFVWLAIVDGFLRQALEAWHGAYPPGVEATFTVAGMVAFFVLLGMLSRQFERQADLFAARALSTDAHGQAPDAVGVSIFNSALLRVAALNNMPLDAGQLYRGRNPLARTYAWLVHHAATWLHGSVRARTEYLQQLLQQPQRGRGFDRRMIVLRLTLLAAAVSTTAWLAVVIARDG